MEKILIVDFGSQYTQLIAKQLRNLKVYTEIIPYNKLNELEINYIYESDVHVKGLILSGSPHSVIDGNYPTINENLIRLSEIPILGICYGSQLIARIYGEEIEKKEIGEFGKQDIIIYDNENNNLLFDIPNKLSVWMSHSDTITTNNNIRVLSKTENNIIASYKVKNKSIYGIQYHPEVSHTQFDQKKISNIINICNIK